MSTALAWRAAQIPAQIENTLAEAIDENGEIINDLAMARLQSLAMEKTVALTDLALFVKQIETVGIAHLDSVISELTAKKRRLAKARDIAFGVIEDLLPHGEKLETDFVSLSWKKNPPAVAIEGAVDLLPERFQRVKTTVDADKKAIKEAIQAGETVPGARLVQGESLKIK